MFVQIIIIKVLLILFLGSKNALLSVSSFDFGSDIGRNANEFQTLDYGDQLLPNLEGAGWMNGSCAVEKINLETIDISKIYAGRWYLAHFVPSPYFSPPRLNPFSINVHRSCIYFEIGHDHETHELVMDFKYRYNNKPNERQKCRIYIKFSRNQRIKYDVAFGCPLDQDLWGIYLAKTDYENYIIIRGCLNINDQYGTKHGFLEMVLNRNFLNISIIQTVKEFLVPRQFKMSTYSVDLRTNITKVPEILSCTDDFCQYPLAGCSPMLILKYPFLSMGNSLWIFFGSVMVLIIIAPFALKLYFRKRGSKATN